ncbi:IpaC/SipC family type III secretion system effector [Paraburkholderia sp. BR10882]|uniref:IpaC/SipC family type III secretion system effector n=1 Tax=unclassified Paraburkholderia TaxID=2615204 RepID=UPI0034CEBDFE
MGTTSLQYEPNGIYDRDRAALLQKDPGAVVMLESQHSAARFRTAADGGLMQPAALWNTESLPSDSSGDAVKLSKPSVQVDAPQFQTRIVERLKREMGDCHKLSNIPCMTGVMAKIMQLTSLPLDGAVKHESRETGTTGSLCGVGSLFGESAVETAFLTMIDVANALQMSKRAETELEGKMAVKMRAAAEASAQATKAQGMEMLRGAIAGSVLQCGLVGMGAQRQFSGLKIKADSIENELKPQAELRRFDREQSSILRGEGGTKLHDEYASVLSQERAERECRIDMHGINHQTNELMGDRLRVQGTVLDATAGVLKTMVDGVTGTMVHNQLALQKFADNDETVAKSVSDAHRQNAQTMQDMTQKILEIAMNTANDNATVASQVASAIKV